MNGQKFSINSRESFVHMLKFFLFLKLPLDLWISRMLNANPTRIRNKMRKYLKLELAKESGHPFI